MLRFFFSPYLAKTRPIARHKRQQFFLRHELREQLRLLRHGAEAAADVELEAAFAVLNDADRADVVDPDQAAGFVAAAGERDLELAAEVLRVGVAEQEIRRRLGVGRDVERLRAADAGDRASRDVADRVAAGLAGGDADGGQAAHDGGRVFDVDEVELEVLARGDVGDRVGVFLGELGQHFQLARVQGRRTGS